MSILDRMLMRSFLKFFFLSLVTLTSLYLMIDLLSKMATLGGEPRLWGQYLVYHTPYILYLFTPVACFFGTVFTLCSMNQQGELRSLYTLGVSLRRLSVPILIIVSAISLSKFVWGDQIVPKTNKKREYVYLVEIRNRPHRYFTIKTNKIWYRVSPFLFNIQTLHPQTFHAEQASFYEFDENWQMVRVITARYVDMTHSTWRLFDGATTQIKNTHAPVTTPFSESTLSMGASVQDIATHIHPSHTQTQKELRQFIDKNKIAGLNTQPYEAEYYSKYGMAFSGILLTLLGIPLAVRRRYMVAIPFCFLITFAYFILENLGLSLGKHYLPPLSSVMMPHLLVFIVASVLFWRTKI